MFQLGPRPERIYYVASLYKRRKKFWISYYLDGKLVQKSLKTDNERVARAKKKKIEYELSIGDLHLATQLPLPAITEAFCQHLKTRITQLARTGCGNAIREFDQLFLRESESESLNPAHCMVVL